MGFGYRVYNQDGLYFVTFTVRQWVDIFTRKLYVDIVLDSLKYCQEFKGLKIYAWVIMSNHIHLIIKSDQHNLSDIIRDFKKYTASQTVKAIESNPKESRKGWLLWLLKNEGKISFWEEGYHGEEIVSPDFFQSKVNYIHLNPVRANIVSKAEEYLYSSCCDYVGNAKGLLELVLINV